MGAYESGQAFLAGVLAKLPESSRAQVEAALTAAEARDAVLTIGDGVLARSDYSRQMDEIRRQSEELERQQQEALDLYTRNQQWWQATEAEYQRLRAGGGQPTPNPTPAPVAPTPPVDPREVAESVVSARERDYAAYVAYVNGLSLRHFQQFGEILPMEDLLADPRLGKPVAGQPNRVVSLPDVYQARYGEQLAAKAKEAEDARINKLVEERVAERTRSLASQPFPMAREASPLDALNNPDAPKLKDDDYLERAMTAYAALQGARA